MSETEKESHHGPGTVQDKEISSASPGAEVGGQDKVVAPAAPSPGGGPQVKPEYPHGIVLSLILVSLMLSMFLVALDMVRLAIYFHAKDRRSSISTVADRHARVSLRLRFPGLPSNSRVWTKSAGTVAPSSSPSPHLCRSGGKHTNISRSNGHF